MHARKNTQISPTLTSLTCMYPTSTVSSGEKSVPFTIAGVGQNTYRRDQGLRRKAWTRSPKPRDRNIAPGCAALNPGDTSA